MSLPSASSLLLSLLLLLGVPREASGGFLGGLKIDPGKIQSDVTHAVKEVSKVSPGELQDDVAKTVKEVVKTRPEDIAESVKGALNGTAVQEVAGSLKDTAEKHASEALQGLTEVGSAAASEVGVGTGESTQATGKELSKVLQTAGSALKQEVGVGTSESTQATGKQLSKALQTAGSTLKQEVDGEPKDMMAGGGKAVEQALQGAAQAGNAPTVAQGLLAAGSKLAKHIVSDKKDVEEVAPSPATSLPVVSQGKGYGWLVAVMVVLASAAIGAFVWLKPGGNEPKLLSDALECSQGFASSARAPSIRPPASETTGFMQF